MNPIDKLFKNNRQAFDRLTPRPETWLSVKEALVLKKQQRKRFFVLKIAAGLALLLSLLTIYSWTPKSEYLNLNHASLSSPEGQMIPLDPALNKYTLVQFWESGNLLCTAENCYYYLPAYEKYKSQGFEIYAISLDKNKSDWVLGIEENQLPWIHVSDLMGWDSPICIECNITKVPSSFLLDQKGKIIARDLNAADLDRTLGRLLAQN